MSFACPYLVTGGDCGYFDAPPPENIMCLCLHDADDAIDTALCPHPVRAVAGEEYAIPTVVGACLLCGQIELPAPPAPTQDPDR